MWMGFQRAVHYLDRFTLLTPRMHTIEGLMSSNYPFYYEREWSLTFELKKRGKDASEKDGFMLLLSRKTITAHESEEHTNDGPAFLEVAVS